MKTTGRTKNRSTRTIRWLTLFLSIGIIFISYPAYAVTLTHWNVTQLNSSGDYVDVTIGTDGSGHTTLSVQWKSGDPAPPNGIGIDKFGFNSTTSVLTCAAGWNCNKGTQTMDGFGSFTQFEKDPGGDGGISSPIVFTLAGLATFTTNGSPHFSTYAAHVRYSNSCSGFVSDGNTTSIGSDNDCKSKKVPEPSTLLFLGTGLVSLGLWGRRTFKTIS